MKNLLQLTAIALLGVASTAGALAGESGTVYSQVGTWGVGIGYAQSINERWALRAQVNPSVAGDVSVFGSTQRTLSSSQLLADWYPGASSLRVSGGIVFNNNTRREVEIFNANTTFTFDTQESETPSPYLGVGYSVQPKAAAGWGLHLDVGAAWLNPKSTVSTRGTAFPTAYTDVLADERKSRVNKVQGVVGVGVSYSF